MHVWRVDCWYDWLRAINAVASAICIVLLLLGYYRESNLWNSKTREYWYALLAWCISGLALSIEGILRQTPPGYRLGFILVASLVTLRGITRKGGWGVKA